MPLVEFTESDLLRNKLVDPAWYKLKIQSCSEWEPSKDQQSNNCKMETVVEANADTGGAEFAGVPIRIQFNSKPTARSFIEGFLRALGVEVEATRYDLANAVGKTVEAYVEHKEYEGRISNTVNHKYRRTRE
jgi:hypothetical protein